MSWLWSCMHVILHHPYLDMFMSDLPTQPLGHILCLPISAFLEIGSSGTTTRDAVFADPQLSWLASW